MTRALVKGISVTASCCFRKIARENAATKSRVDAG
jgi:hypothetical protein